MAEDTKPLDRLTVTGLGAIDGEYEFDMLAMLTIGHPEQLTNREGRRVKLMSGVRAGELGDAFSAGDNDVLVAIAAIVLTRHRKRVNEDQLWDAAMGSALSFEIADRPDPVEEEEGDVGPPAVAPPLAEAPRSGGESSPPDSDPQANGQDPTGIPDWPRSAISDRVISGI